ncbi:MAG: GldG family protein [Acidobacteriota bacterium]
MANQWNKARQTRYALYAVLYILVVIAAAVIVNVLANRYDKTWDSTSNKRYSLSEETHKIVGGLKQDATILYFNQSTRFAQARDLLDEYKNLSPRVRIHYVDPDKNPALTRADGVQNMGTAIVQIGDRKATATAFSEEGITGAFIRDIKTNTRTVCFVTGSGEHQIDASGRDGLSEFKTDLAKESYQTQSIDLLSKAQVPADCTVAVVAGPQHDYPLTEVDAIQKYVQGGGRAMFLLDPPLKGRVTNIAANDALDSMLSGWGITLQKDLVLDLNPIGQITGTGPEIPLVTSYDSQPIVDDLRGNATGFPLSRSLDVHDTPHTTVQALFSSSSSSLADTDLAATEVRVNDPSNRKGPQTLGAAGTYNAGKAGAQGRFVVIGSSTWITNSFLNFNGNADLAVNAINWLASDEDLISIHPKAPDNRPVTMTKAQMALVRITSQFILPLIMIVLGTLVWWRRRRG